MTLEQLKDKIETFFDVDITEKSRRYDKVKVRFMFYKLAFEYVTEPLSYPKVGGFLGFTHASVINGIKKFYDFTSYDKQFKKEVELFEDKIFQELADIKLEKLRTQKKIIEERISELEMNKRLKSA